MAMTRARPDAPTMSTRALPDCVGFVRLGSIHVDAVEELQEVREHSDAVGDLGVGQVAAGDLDASVEGFMLFAAGPHRTLDDLDPGVVRRLRRMARGTMSKHTGDEPNRLVPVRDTWDRAAKIDVPVLAVNGAIDSPDHIGMAERLVRTVANGRAISIDGTTHYPNMERPDVFNEILEDFLRAG
jgi:pimeloyl-ACP methyl ester carboxylesterase